MPKYFAYYADGKGPRQKTSANTRSELVEEFRQIIDRHRHYFKPQSLHMTIYDARPNEFKLISKLTVGPNRGVKIKRFKQ